jgi:hypothetical protein
VLDGGRRFGGSEPDQIERLQRSVVPGEHASRAALRLLRKGVWDQRYVEILGSFYRAFSLAADASVVIDSSKVPGDALLVRAIGDLRTVAVHVGRDPRGTVLSQLRRTPGYVDGRSSPLRAGRRAIGWVGRNTVCGLVSKRFGVRSIRVRYEDAVADPDRFVADVSRIVRRPPSPVPIDARGRVLLPTGHGASADAGAWRATDVALTDAREWRQVLPNLDRTVIEAVCLPAMRRYGYRVGG